jgi:TolB-like protein
MHHSLAVLGGAFAAGVACRLETLPALRVIPPDRTKTIDLGEIPPEEIGRALHVACVAVCSLAESQSGIDLRIELIDTLSERLLGEETFLARAAERARLEQQAARWIARQLGHPFTSNSQR